MHLPTEKPDDPSRSFANWERDRTAAAEGAASLRAVCAKEKLTRLDCLSVRRAPIVDTSKDMKEEEEIRVG